MEEYLTNGQPQGAALKAWQKAQRQAQAPAPAQITSPEGEALTTKPTDTFWVTEPELDPSVALAVRLSVEEEAKEAARVHQLEEDAQLALSLAEEGDPLRGVPAPEKTGRTPQHAGAQSQE